MPYRHKIIQGLADLVNTYGGKGKDPIMNAVWWGIKGQVPNLLQGLDDNEEAIAEIEAKLREVLGIEEPKPEPVLTSPVEIEYEGKAGDKVELPQPVKEEPVGQTEAPEEKEVKTKDKKKKRKGKAIKE